MARGRENGKTLRKDSEKFLLFVVKIFEGIFFCMVLYGFIVFGKVPQLDPGFSFLLAPSAFQGTFFLGVSRVFEKVLGVL